jgi:hypothetical protein
MFRTILTIQRDYLLDKHEPVCLCKVYVLSVLCSRNWILKYHLNVIIEIQLQNNVYISDLNRILTHSCWTERH